MRVLLPYHLIPPLMSKRYVPGSPSLPFSPALQYLIFVSYAEIYNELIYDLLVPTGKSTLGNHSACTARCQRHKANGTQTPAHEHGFRHFSTGMERTSKKLRTDKNKNVYVSGKLQSCQTDWTLTLAC